MNRVLGPTGIVFFLNAGLLVNALKVRNRRAVLPIAKFVVEDVHLLSFAFADATGVDKNILQHVLGVPRPILAVAQQVFVFTDLGKPIGSAPGEGETTEEKKCFFHS